MAKKNVLQFIATGRNLARRLRLTFTPAEAAELKTYSQPEQEDTRLLLAYYAGITAGYNARKREERRQAEASAKRSAKKAEKDRRELLQEIGQELGYKPYEIEMALEGATKKGGKA